ncbi:MAG: 16S rRNA (adenine(1518)-N(6)/adenine(1519)-N(6))-dimethyltransferase RsmA [Thiohalomonadaceae bacterium]
MEHRARKRFGQNFLHDPRIIQGIVSAIHPKPEDHLVEIGPGMGALTGPLLDSGARLDVVELDRDLIPILHKTLGSPANLQIHQHDALKFDFCQLAEPGQSLRVIGNLPYNISTPLIFHLLDQAHCIRDMHFMLQKEVVDRLAAGPGCGDYGRLGIMVQTRCEVEQLFTVPPGSFHPAPKVDSAIVRLTPWQTPPHAIQDPALFAKLVSQAFMQRRKTLRNNLKGLIDAAALETLGIDPGRRPETLSIEEFARIANHLA